MNGKHLFWRTLFVTSVVGIAVLPTAIAVGQGTTYTTTSDFNQGALFNTNLDTPDQVELNTGTFVTLPNLWIANAGDDTLSKFDTNTNRELARYRTWFAPPGPHSPFAGPAPSRSSVDANGNCYILNRHFDGRPASLLKILGTGGIDRNGNGVIDTSVDTNGNGTIDPAEIIPLVDGNANGVLEDAELADERVAWIRQIGGNGGLGRSLSIDPNGFVWVGLYSARQYWKVDSNGAIVTGPISTTGSHTPYGSVVDSGGTLWGASLGSTLLELNTNTNTLVAVHTHNSQDYGIAFGNGRVYKAGFLGGAGSGPILSYDPNTSTFSFLATTIPRRSRGIGVDSNGDIVLSHGPTASTAGCTKYAPDGTVIWSSAPQPGATANEMRGCIPDANNDIWTVNLNSNSISKYRGTDGAALGVFPTGSSPYTYSDASGSSLFGQGIQRGTWTAIEDAGGNDRDWGCVEWNADVPQDTALKVEVRAANELADLDLQNFVEVQNGVSFCGTGIAGRYLECKVTFDRTDPEATNTPVLFDITIQACGPTDLTGRPKRSKVELRWTAVPGAVSYNCYRSQTSGGPYQLIGSATGTFFLDQTVTLGETYYYVCTADNQGESCTSGEIEVTVRGRR